MVPWVHNALVDRMDEIYGILKPVVDMDEQIRIRYIDLINSSSNFFTDVYESDEHQEESYRKLKRLVIILQHQKATTSTFERFMTITSCDKRKGTVHTPVSGLDYSDVPDSRDQGITLAERFLELRPLILD